MLQPAAPFKTSPQWWDFRYQPYMYGSALRNPFLGTYQHPRHWRASGLLGGIIGVANLPSVSVQRTEAKMCDDPIRSFWLLEPPWCTVSCTRRELLRNWLREKIGIWKLAACKRQMSQLLLLKAAAWCATLSPFITYWVPNHWNRASSLFYFGHCNSAASPILPVLLVATE